MAYRITTPFYAEAYPNRVDLLGVTITYDPEGGRQEALCLVARAVPCVVQEATPRLLEDLGLVGREEAQVIVFVHSSRLPAGVEPNRKLRQTDVDPTLDYRVIGVRDLCGMHTDYAIVCASVE